MKLCAQITSERGKTIQKTGNEYIHVEMLSDRKKLAEARLSHDHDRDWVQLFDKDGRLLYQTSWPQTTIENPIELLNKLHRGESII